MYVRAGPSKSNQDSSPKKAIKEEEKRKRGRTEKAEEVDSVHTMNTDELQCDTLYECD